MRAEKLNEAIIFASQMHSEQVDKRGEPYILHPLRVMQAVWDVTKDLDKNDRRGIARHDGRL